MNNAKNILLIGGSTGIGAEIITNLQEKHPNYKLYVACRTSEGIPANVTYFKFDVLTDTIQELDLPNELDGLVYCPGSINLKPFSMLKQEHFETDMQLNFLSIVKILKGIESKLKAAENASVVLFSTVAVKVGMPFHSSIAAAKGALEAFGKSLAAEWAPKIRVNSIAPSLTDTPLAKRLLGNAKKKEKMDERHPLKRVGTPSDIANVAVFLLSEESSWMTGQVIGIDGGISTLNTN